MAANIEEVLRELDAWYSELPNGSERPQLLSKLATLELCGWLEERFDRLAINVASKAGVHETTTIKERINRTYGFSYADHVRPLFVAIGGELLAAKVELSIEKNSPGELERLKNMLGTLWSTRKSLAHMSFVGPAATQVTMNAPSWSVSQQKDLGVLIEKLEVEVLNALPDNTATKP